MADLDIKGLLDFIGSQGGVKEIFGLKDILSPNKGAISNREGLLSETKVATSETKGATSDSESANTIRFLRSQGQHNLADMVESGAMTASAAMQLGIRSLTERGYGAMSEAEIGKYPDVGWTNMDDSQEVKTFLDNMPHEDRVKVEAMRQRLEDINQSHKFPNFINDLMSRDTYTGALHADPLPTAAGFQQYRTGNPHLQNLGFMGAY